VTLVFIVFVVCTAIQILYWLGIFSGLAFYHPPENHRSTADAESEGVSVIVCTHNELHNLKNLVPRLSTQDYPRYEVIIVDDRSTDGTEAWFRAQEVASPNFKLVSVSGVPQGYNPKKHALTEGIKKASHELLVLTDADCLPISNNWIREVTARYNKHTEIVLGYSGYQKTAGLLNKLIRYETLVTAIQYLSRALDKSPYMGVGRNLSYRRSFFKRVDGLSGVMAITGGDDDLLVNKNAHRNNTAVCLTPGSFVVSVPKTSWKAYFRQKVRHLSAGKYYRTSSKLILGIFRSRADRTRRGS
jgi:glycosyltransferase involved in cell wall biosynthesis